MVVKRCCANGGGAGASAGVYIWVGGGAAGEGELNSPVVHSSFARCEVRIEHRRRWLVEDFVVDANVVVDGARGHGAAHAARRTASSRHLRD